MEIDKEVIEVVNNKSEQLSDDEYLALDIVKNAFDKAKIDYQEDYAGSLLIHNNGKLFTITVEKI